MISSIGFHKSEMKIRNKLKFESELPKFLSFSLLSMIDSNRLKRKTFFFIPLNNWGFKNLFVRYLGFYLHSRRNYTFEEVYLSFLILTWIVDRALSLIETTTEMLRRIDGNIRYCDSRIPSRRKRALKGIWHRHWPIVETLVFTMSRFPYSWSDLAWKRTAIPRFPRTPYHSTNIAALLSQPFVSSLFVGILLNYWLWDIGRTLLFAWHDVRSSQ